jgi:phospho-N-acetylmuramoyl-pentapeptide-transferase
MGDSGSLSVGGSIGYLSIVTKTEILLILIGFIFIMETLSVMLQVGSYKTRKKRIFLMAPIHHHFELKGWSENQVTIRFWIIALITNLIAILSIKIR